MRWKQFVLPVLGLFLMACEGPAGDAGPMGPAGPQGERGEPGPGTRIVLTGTTSGNGSASAQLPAEAGTMSNPPSIVCYLSDNPDGPFLQLSTEFYVGVTCGLVQNAGALHAVLTGAPPGWYYRLVVIH